jgi:hypothetical protein
MKRGDKEMKKVKIASVLLVVLLVVSFGLTLAASVGAQSTEVLYLANMKSANDGTDLLSVNLDHNTMLANLTLVTTIPLDSSAAIAAPADGSKVYCIDWTGYEANSMMGYYEVATDSWYYLSNVTKSGTTATLRDIIQAAFSPTDGLLYVVSRWSGHGSANDNSVYTVDTGTGIATKVGKLYVNGTDTPIILSGADIAFTADGTLYIWNNNPSFRGLWELNLPAVSGRVYADNVGSGPAGNPFFTGLAVRANGYGDLVGSTSGTRPSYIFVISKSDASSEGQFAMYKGGNYYNWYGDMTVGPLVLCTKTIGYWKNHDWDGQVVQICGDSYIGENVGKEILRNARGRDFSMFFAQLIAAKLNTNNATGIAVIDDAEAWLCSQSVEWDDEFESKSQKRVAAGYWEALDEFNNQFHCE